MYASKQLVFGTQGIENDLAGNRKQICIEKIPNCPNSYFVNAVHVYTTVYTCTQWTYVSVYTCTQMCTHVHTWTYVSVYTCTQLCT